MDDFSESSITPTTTKIKGLYGIVRTEGGEARVLYMLYNPNRGG